MIRSLQSFRFIFAILIFLHHSAVNFQAGGSCGVSFFMILSGFVMTAGYAQKVTEPVFNYKSFLLNRLFRLYPLHLLCLFVFIALQFSSLNYIGYFKLVPNLLLLQSWIPGMNYYFSGNAVSWCLSDMIFFYAMFPLLIRGYQKLNNKLLIWTLLSLGAFYFIILFSIPESYVHRILYISPLFRLLDFIIGILLYQLFLYFQKSGIEEKIGHWSFSRKTGIELLSVLLMALLLLLFPYVSERFICASYYWIPISFLIMVFALFNKTGGVFLVF
ncbi:MAG: acyltransferase [Bacteroides sp.]